MIEAIKVFEIFQKHRGNSIVHVQGTSGYHWNGITKNPNRDINFDDAMGQSTSAIFGLALGLENEKIVHFDTEGALLMNLGVLASIAGKQPKNFIHFLLDNECYATTGGQPVPNAEYIDYAQMAAAAGYPVTYNFTDLEKLTTSMEKIMNTKGPVFVAIKINPEIENLPMGLRENHHTRTIIQTINDLRKELNIK
jgi:thiamine pyrophosphate-dependent acetolactate synthase large subunit-like protein|tara:strand:- start:2676 stop:3260 length:585 start_codon:yes stop_codon:yes gene_type:complete